MKLWISKGNSKLGKIPSVSLPPGLSCVKGVPCFKEGCYAKRHIWDRFPLVRTQWTENWMLWQTDPADYVRQIRGYLEAKKPARWRWHVGGDIPSKSYYEWMVAIALAHPDTVFLAFSKCYQYAGIKRPPNLTLVFSRWPGYPCPDLGDAPQAWMLDEKRKDVYIPKNATICPGSCATCSKCFLAKPGEHVVFKKH